MDAMDSQAIELGKRISALCDGALPAKELAQTMADLSAHSEGVSTWHTYHVIGDVLRSEAMAPAVQELDFLERLEKRLAQEPMRVVEPVPLSHAPETTRDSSNASVYRWKWLAGVSFALLLSTVAAGLWKQDLNSAGQLAAKGNSLVASAPDIPSQGDGLVMIRDPELDALMAAHRQLGGHSALQGPAGFLRNATLERPVR
jgi:sigma-E factor negative regulatory protein RseA